MSRAQDFAEQYAFHTSLIQNHIEGVTDTESLLQPPFDANCMNWVLGHIISRRQSSLEALGSEPLWGEQRMRIYITGSDPITSADRAVSFRTLREALQHSNERLRAALEHASAEQLEQLVVNDRGEKSAAEHLEGFLWHETYHIGQLDLLQAFINSTRHA